MSKTITANIPARKSTWGGKPHTFPARTDTFTQDDAGRWTSPDKGALSEADVINVCRKASNWPQIRAEHFPMFGFSV